MSRVCNSSLLFLISWMQSRLKIICNSSQANYEIAFPFYILTWYTRGNKVGLRGGGGAQSEEETVFCSKDPAWFVNIPWDKGKGGLPTGKCIRLVAIKFAKCLRQFPVYALSYPTCMYTYVDDTAVQRYSNPPARYNNGIFKYTVDMQSFWISVPVS